MCVVSDYFNVNMILDKLITSTQEYYGVHGDFLSVKTNISLTHRKV